MRISRSLTLLALLGLAAAPLAAQGEPSVKFAIGPALTLPSGDFNDAFKMGWGALGAVSYKPPAVPFAFRLDLSLSQVDDETPIDLKDQIVYGTGNFMYSFDVQGTIVRPYVLGGAGIYYFNPRGDAAVGLDSSTDFGLNFGAGIEVAPRQVGLFAESRFHNVFTEGSDTQFGALVVGLRFGAF